MHRAGVRLGLALLAAALAAPASAWADGELTQKAGPAGCVTFDGSEDCTTAAQVGRMAVVSPDGKFIYTEAWEPRAAIQIFKRDTATGIATPIPAVDEGCWQNTGSGGCEVLGLTKPSGIAIDPDGENLYVSDFHTGTILTFDIDDTTGLLTRKPDVEGCMVVNGNGVNCANSPASSLAFHLLVSPDGKNVYAQSQQGGGAVTAYKRDPGTGVLDGAHSGRRLLHLQRRQRGRRVPRDDLLRRPRPPCARGDRHRCRRRERLRRFPREGGDGVRPRPRHRLVDSEGGHRRLLGGAERRAGGLPGRRRHRRRRRPVRPRPQPRRQERLRRDRRQPRDLQARHRHRRAHPARRGVRRLRLVPGRSAASRRPDGMDGPLDAAVSTDGLQVYVATGSGSLNSGVAVFDRDPASRPADAEAGKRRLPFRERQRWEMHRPCARLPAATVMVSPDGKNVYANNGGGAMAIFDRDQPSAARARPRTLVRPGPGPGGPTGGIGTQTATAIVARPDGRQRARGTSACRSSAGRRRATTPTRPRCC